MLNNISRKMKKISCDFIYTRVVRAEGRTGAAQDWGQSLHALLVGVQNGKAW